MFYWFWQVVIRTLKGEHKRIDSQVGFKRRNDAKLNYEANRDYMISTGQVHPEADIVDFQFILARKPPERYIHNDGSIGRDQ